MVRTSRIVVIFIMLLLSITVLISTTYGWFTNNLGAEATDLSIRVQSSRQLDVSTDARSWYKTVTLENIMNADYVVDRYNQVPVEFQPTSTIGELDNGQVKMFVGSVKTDRDVNSPNYNKLVLTAKREVEQNGETGSFLTFDLYFNNNNMATELYLGKNSYVKYDTEEEDKGLQNAIRMAFVLEGTTTSKDLNDIQSMETDNFNNVVIWEPNFDVHTETSINAAKHYYGLTEIESPMLAYIDYLGVKNDITTPELITSRNELFFGTTARMVRTTHDYENSKADSKKLFDLPAGISKVRVYAWIEGQDVDCQNEAAGSSFIYNLHFSNSKE